MTISAVSSMTQPKTNEAAAAKGEKPLDKEAFLKLLVAQLSHQDPTAPKEGTEFVAQLSQFAMVEQSLAQSQKLDAISNQMTGIASNEATRLVGNQVALKDENGKEVTGKVTKVGFDKGYPEVTLDSGVKAPISNLISVTGGSVR